MKIFFVFAIVFLTAMATSAQPAGSSLAGAWKVLADQQTDRAGKVIAEDTSVSGLLIYTREGKMNIQILWRARRQPMMTDTVMNGDGFSAGLGLGKNSWSDIDRARIIDSYDAYFGDYSVDWETHTVTHTITGNLRPEKPGTVYKRRFQLKGDLLFLKSTDTTMTWQVKFIRIKS